MDVLETELRLIEEVFRGLSDEEWRAPTKLVPLDGDKPHCTVFEIADHFDISIRLTRMLIADPQEAVEVVMHGTDLTDALGRDRLATNEAVAITADILDDLLARRTVPGRPRDRQDDDWAWIGAASGRGTHDDPRLPLIG